MSKVNKQTISKQLAKCPFCGGEHIIKTYFNWNPALLCSCGAVMTVPMDWRTNKEEELERKWNTRKPVDDVVEDLEELEEKFFHSDFEADRFDLGAFVAYRNAVDIVKEHLT